MKNIINIETEEIIGGDLIEFTLTWYTNCVETDRIIKKFKNEIEYNKFIYMLLCYVLKFQK